MSSAERLEWWRFDCAVTGVAQRKRGLGGASWTDHLAGAGVADQGDQIG